MPLHLPGITWVGAVVADKSRGSRGWLLPLGSFWGASEVLRSSPRISPGMELSRCLRCVTPVGFLVGGLRGGGSCWGAQLGRLWQRSK